ncbi:MAG: T9SS C-terminal target domain-containing protein [Calditrichaeota bacterium]|nr:MAG: T9SS C-terminal target domain-containing protein [Calditrichota bacterium]
MNKTLLLLFFLPVILFGQITWTQTQIATETGQQPNIATDPLGNIHVVWVNTDDKVVHISNQHNGWGQKRVIAGENYSYTWYPNVVGDNLGFYHVAYRKEASSVRYVTNNPDASWPGVMSGDHFHEVGIEVGTDLVPHLFAEADNAGSMIYYQNMNSPVLPWDSLAAGTRVAFYSTAIDKDNNVHLAVGYWAAGDTAESVNYVNNVSGNWSAPVKIENFGVNANWPSLAIDSHGFLHLAFLSAGENAEIYYTNNVQGDWIVPVNISNDGAEDVIPSMVLDDFGHAHVVWEKRSGTASLYYNYFDGSNWGVPSMAVPFINDVGKDITHINHKIALDIKSNTVYVPYSSAGGVYLAHHSNLHLRTAATDTDTTTMLQLAEGFTFPTNISSNANSETAALEVFKFTLHDAGGDGKPTKVNKVIFQAGQNMPLQYTLTEGGVELDFGYTAALGGAILETTTGESFTGLVYKERIIFSVPGTGFITIPEADSVDFTLKVWLKTSLAGLDGLNLDFKINGLYDVIIDSTGSLFSFDNVNTASSAIPIQMAPHGMIFNNLQSGFPGENLAYSYFGVNGFTVELVDINGNKLSSVNGSDLTLSLVGNDSVSVANAVLSTTDVNGLVKSLTDGTVAWDNLTIDTAGKYVIKAVLDSITDFTKPVGSLPVAENLLLLTSPPNNFQTHNFQEIFEETGIKLDVLHLGHTPFPDAGQLSNYKKVIFTGDGVVEHAELDTTALEQYLNPAESEEPRPAVLFAGANTTARLAYFYPTFTSRVLGIDQQAYFSEYNTSVAGYAGDPISAGFTASFPENFSGMELTPTNDATAFLVESNNDKVIGLRLFNGVSRVATLIFEFQKLAQNNRTDLLSRIFSWFDGPPPPKSSPVFASNLPDSTFLEDNTLSIAYSTWFEFVEDADTPDSDLIWGCIGGVDLKITTDGDSVHFTPPDNWFGTENFQIIVSDGENHDTTGLAISVIPVNDPPNEFDLLAPADDASFQNDAQITLIWEASIDVDNDAVSYILQFTTNSGYDTSFALDTTAFVIDLTTWDFPLEETITWQVTASDSDSSIIAQNGPRTFAVVLPSSVETFESNTPDKFTLLQNYPNPFNPTTVIRFGLPEPAEVHITIYDLLGKEIVKLVEQSYSPGWYSVHWDARNANGRFVGTGVYLYKIRSGNFVQIKKMILLR